MKIAFLNDTHAGIRGGSPIMMEYQEEFYSKVFFPYLKENNIDQIIHLGDYYDVRRNINIQVLKHNNTCFLDKLDEYGITMHIIPGNHDVYFKSSNYPNSLDELMGHRNSVNIYNEPIELDFAGYLIALIPWINRENYQKTIDFIKSTKAAFVGGHFEFNGFEMSKGILNTHGMTTELFKRFEYVVSGHFHTKSQQKNVQYFGSQMEFTWADYNDPKFFHVFDTDTREITAVNNPLTLYHKIEYNDVLYNYSEIEFSPESFKGKYVKIVVLKKSDALLFDRVVEKIKNFDPYEVKILENFHEYSGKKVDDSNMSIEDTETLMNTYIDLVDTDLDKDKLKSTMTELYANALSSEVF